MPGSLYCEAHQDQAPNPKTSRPWYKHPAVKVGATIVSLALGPLSLWATIYYGYTGATKEGLTETNKRIDQTNDFVRAMMILQNDSKLLQKYPQGYCLFAVDHKRNIFPNYSKLYEKWNIDWSVAAIEDITRRMISIRLPDINPKDGISKITDISVRVPRVPGSSRKFLVSNIEILIEFIEHEAGGFIFLMSLSELPPNHPLYLPYPKIKK